MTQTIVPVQAVVAATSGGVAALADATDATYIALERISIGQRVAVYKLGQAFQPAAATAPTVNYRYERENAGTIDLLVELRQGYVGESGLGTLIGSATHTGVGDAITAGSFLASTAAVAYVGGVATPDLYLRFVESIPAASSPPTITGITPASGPVGTLVTIDGTGFIAGDTEVDFDAVVVPVGSVTVLSATQLTCLVPAGATGAAVVKVETSVGLSAGSQTFTVTWVPVLVSKMHDDSNVNTYLVADNVDYKAGWLYFVAVLIQESGGDAQVGGCNGTGQTWTRVTDDGAAFPVASAWGAAVWRFAPSADLIGADTTWDGAAPATGLHDGIVAFVVGIPPGFLTGGTNGSNAIGAKDEVLVSAATAAAALSPAPASTSMALAIVGHSNNETNTAIGGTAVLDQEQGAAPNRSAALVYDASTPGANPGASWTTSANVRLVAWEVKHA